MVIGLSFALAAIVVVCFTAIRMARGQSISFRRGESKTVRLARDRTKISQADLETARADAEKDVIETKRAQLVNAILNEDEEKQNALLSGLREEKTEKPRY